MELEDEEKITELSEERKGQIALAMLKDEFTKKARTLNRTDIMKEIGQMGEQLRKKGITKEEITAIYRELISDAVENIFKV